MSLEVAKARARLFRIGTNLPVYVSWLPLSWSGVGVLVVGMLLARWTWILFAPQPLSVFLPKADFRKTESESIFGTAASSAMIANNVSTVLGNVHLMGVFSGKEGFAVLKFDDKTQRGVALGEEVIKGTKLIEVDADHVVLEHNGSRQQLFLESKSGKNKDNLILEQPSSISGVDQAVAGWNQAHQVMKKERTQLRREKIKEVLQ